VVVLLGAGAEVRYIQAGTVRLSVPQCLFELRKLVSDGLPQFRILDSQLYIKLSPNYGYLHFHPAQLRWVELHRELGSAAALRILRLTDDLTMNSGGDLHGGTPYGLAMLGDVSSLVGPPARICLRLQLLSDSPRRSISRAGALCSVHDRRAFLKIAFAGAKVPALPCGNHACPLLPHGRSANRFTRMAAVSRPVTSCKAAPICRRLDVTCGIRRLKALTGPALSGRLAHDRPNEVVARQGSLDP